MEYTQDNLLREGFEILTMTQYIDRFHPKERVAAETLRYNMQEGKIDFIRIGSHRLVVIKNGFNSYSPNKHKNRK